MRSVKTDRYQERLELAPHAAAASALAAMRRPAELWLLGILLVSYCLVYSFDASELYHVMNLIGPAILMTILGWSCYEMVRRRPITVWAPLFWFRIACGAYYGFGALAPHIANDETRQHIYSLYYFDDFLNLKVNLIYCAGIFCTIFFSHLFLFLSGPRRRASYISGGGARPSHTLFFALGFLLIGGGLRYGFVLPYAFGLTTIVLPGAIGTLSKMYYVGVYLLVVYGLSHNKKILPIVSLLIGLEIIVSVASFAKTELLLILIFSFLGFINRQASKTRVLVGASCVLLAYFMFQSLVGYGRHQLATRYGEIRGAGLAERWAIVQNYLDEGRDNIVSTRQGGLSRLSYVNIGAFVVDRYDFGTPGNTLRNAAAVIIPRALWPDKPIITQLGADLYFSVRGRGGTSLGVGHFAEAYWNFGWFGIVPFMGVLSLILSAFTRVSMRIMAYKDWLLLPFVFIGINMGLRVDGHFVPDILGAGWIAVCLGIGLMAIKPLLRMLTYPAVPRAGGTVGARRAS